VPHAAGEQRLSYGELEARSNQLAHYLRGLGVGPETVVGLCVERSLATLVGLLGILKAGGAYLPLDPAYPAERLTFMLADAGAAVLVTDAALADRRPFDGTLVRLDGDWPVIARQPATAPEVGLDPRHPAYVIYTSGSTGAPKGVVVEHASLANKLTTLNRQLGTNFELRTALNISCSFDAAVEQTLLPLVVGGAAVVIDDVTRETPAEFWRQINDHGVSFISGVPSFLTSVLRYAPKSTSVHHIALGGEALTADFTREISRCLDVGTITNLYGPTEATIDAISFAVANPETGRLVPIGRPMANYRVYVLDGGLEPVPVGVAG
jgi:amino acid adenylation domain-containing protein